MYVCSTSTSTTACTLHNYESITAHLLRLCASIGSAHDEAERLTLELHELLQLSVDLQRELARRGDDHCEGEGIIWRELVVGMCVGG